MAELSPAAKAVLHTVRHCPCEIAHDIAAAALRALADQVVPLSTNLRQNKIRSDILAIAAELEGKQ